MAERIGHAERERVVDELRRHAGEGRLDLDELEQRLEAALSARTQSDLEPLLADLPGPRPGRARMTLTRAVAPGSVAAALLPLAAAAAIIAWAPHGFTWIGWTLGFWWFFAGLPSAGLGFAWCGHRKARRSCLRRSRHRDRAVTV